MTIERSTQYWSITFLSTVGHCLRFCFREQRVGFLINTSSFRLHGHLVSMNQGTELLRANRFSVNR